VANYRKKSASVVPHSVTVPLSTPIAARGLRVAEVAAYTGATVCAVRAAIASGTLPVLLLGKRHVILREDADVWLNELRAAA
jgi:hypothetical protein